MAAANEKLPPREAMMGKGRFRAGPAGPPSPGAAAGGPQAVPASGLRMRGERPGKASRRASRPSLLPAAFMCL